jgi:hypothetical protein
MLPYFSDFSLFCQNFHWGNERKNLSGLPGRKGLNIAFEAVERHANSHLKGSVALRRLRKDKRVEEATYADLQRRRSQVAVRQRDRNARRRAKRRRFFFCRKGSRTLHSGAGDVEKAAIFCPNIINQNNFSMKKAILLMVLSCGMFTTEAQTILNFPAPNVAVEKIDATSVHLGLGLSVPFPFGGVFSATFSLKSGWGGSVTYNTLSLGTTDYPSDYMGGSWVIFHHNLF